MDVKDPREFVTIQIEEEEYTLQIVKGTKAKYGRDGECSITRHYNQFAV
jgi:hypothetical protein